MIAVRIPEEIKKYKEKILFGLTARQLVSSIIALAVCVPLYWFGRNYIKEDVLSWLIILIALPLLGIGFFRFNGMAFEKFIVACLKFEILFPRTRKFKTENAFREWQNEAIKEEQPKGIRARKKAIKERKEENLEKTFLLAEAEANGTATYSTDPNAEKAYTYDVDQQDLLTVRKSKKDGGKNGKNKKKDDKQEKEKKKSSLQLKAEEIEQKRKENPEYVPTKKEFNILSKWYKKKEQLRRKEVKQGKVKIQKKAKAMKKRRTAKSSIPRTTQNSIPYLADYEEGLFEITENKYSKIYRIKDINYRTGREDEQVQIFCKLGEFLNYFSEEMRFAFVIDNRVVSKAEQEKKVFKKMKVCK